MKILNKRGLDIDPSGTPRTMSSHPVKEEPIFTR